ncbi:putative phthalate transporter [Aspergillus novofumigatus IBT 16806]|uniref:Putative phthalate transporter n=1 Tax=Aspergillus novofumigatus (strain IBT 16806) TaxID=1392255 RepID=A0A2I1C6T7_ASPN1|nr:putative phthalate transporter [Aspergillus novofumigatus IBT 16806]PKX93349.1 putative phthalate transporter [Aspergillus novofumigatus IBT 16806]
MSPPTSEKPGSAEKVEVEDVGQRALDNVDYDEEYSYEEQRKIIHRVDRRLVTMTGLAYCVSLMDRTNLSMAAVAGMIKELGLHVGTRYSVIVLIFFVPYVIFQPAMTVITRKLGPTFFLGAIVISWGAILIGMGFTKDWKQMTACRALLGLLEAGYFPGCVYLLSSWYVRYDVQKRFSVFYLIGCVASALAGILAFGLSQMAGIQGLGGWRWIFIMEGVITGIIGVLTLLLLVDFPDRAHKSWRFLSEKECAFISNPLPHPALDPKIWGFAMIFLCTTTVTYAIAYFLPIILQQGMGYSVGASQCLYRVRGVLVAINSILCLIGLPILGFHSNNAVRYFGVFLATAGANANIPAIMAYQANNVRGQWTRACSSATLVGFGGIGGIVSSLVFRSQDAPGYRPGMWTTIGCNILILIIVASMSVWFRICNKQADRGQRIIEGSANFRYTI